MAHPYTLTTLIKIRKCCFLQHTCNKTSKFYNSSTPTRMSVHHCPIALQFIDEVERVLKKLPCELADLGRAATGRAECSQYAQLKAAAAVQQHRWRCTYLRGVDSLVCMIQAAASAATQAKRVV